MFKCSMGFGPVRSLSTWVTQQTKRVPNRCSTELRHGSGNKMNFWSYLQGRRARTRLPFGRMFRCLALIALGLRIGGGGPVCPVLFGGFPTQNGIKAGSLQRRVQSLIANLDFEAWQRDGRVAS